MKIETIVLSEDFLPKYQTEGAAAMDLYSSLYYKLFPGESASVRTGVMLHIGDPNVVGIVSLRSGFSKRLLRLTNSIGVIDSDYQGEIILNIHNNGNKVQVISRGDRIAQIMFLPILRPTLEQVDQFSSVSKRGVGGFGSTGDK